MLENRVKFSETGIFLYLIFTSRLQAKYFPNWRTNYADTLESLRSFTRQQSHCKKQTFWPIQMESSKLCYQKYLQYKIFIDHLMNNTAHLNMWQIAWLFFDFSTKIWNFPVEQLLNSPKWNLLVPCYCIYDILSMWNKANQERNTHVPN